MHISLFQIPSFERGSPWHLYLEADPSLNLVPLRNAYSRLQLLIETARNSCSGGLMGYRMANMCFTQELVARPSTILAQELHRGRDIGHAWPLTTEWSICGQLPNMRLNLVISGWKTLHQRSVND